MFFHFLFFLSLFIRVRTGIGTGIGMGGWDTVGWLVGMIMISISIVVKLA